MPAKQRANVIAPVLARLHAASLQAGLPQRPGCSSIDEKPRWYGWEQTRVKLIAAFGCGTGIAGTIATIDRTIAELDELFDHWQSTGRLATRATVHGDLNARNQLYRDGRLVGIIDTDECRVEPLIADIADLAYASPDVTPDEIWHDYLRAGGVFDPSDRDMLVHLANASHLSNLLWLIDEHGKPHDFAPRMLGDIGQTIIDRGTRT